MAQTAPDKSTAWIEVNPSAAPETGYDAYVRGAVAKGKAQIEAGQGIPAARVWEGLGIE